MTDAKDLESPLCGFVLHLAQRSVEAHVVGGMDVWGQIGEASGKYAVEFAGPHRRGLIHRTVLSPDGFGNLPARATCTDI